MDDPLREERVLATVEAVWAAYEAGSPEFFDFFTEDASIFSPSFPTRLAGREAYRRHFGPHLKAQRRASHILHPEVCFVGEGALVTYHSRVRINYSFVDNRITLLLVPQGGRLQIAHLHTSPLAAPQPAETAGLIEDIAVAWTADS
jgi:hypothetical protein